MRRFTFLLAACLSAAAHLFAQDGADLTDGTLPRYRELILPDPADEKWRDIPWRTTYWAAVQEGQKREMPILLWTMNGHPLACT